MLTTSQNEQAVVGSIIIDPDYALPLVTAILSENDFHYDATKAVFKAAVALSGEGKIVDPLTIIEKANEMGFRLEPSYVMDSMGTVLTAANVEAYAVLVKEDSKRRKLLNIADEIQGSISDHQSPDEVTGKVYALLDDVDSKTSISLISTQDAITEFFKYREEVDKNGAKTIIKTGYSDVDSMLGGGLMRGGLYHIAGRPGMAKTTTGICILENMAAAGYPTLLISLEMQSRELTAKRLSRESGVRYSKIMFGRLSDTEYQSLNAAASKIYTHNMTVTRNAHMTVNDIMLEARRVKGLQCLCIDHFSLIMPTNRKADRVTQYTEISNELKRMAKTLDIPIILLMQLNRANEARANKRPMLSDLRETGAAEQDADAVIFLHRESYYDPDAKPLNDWEPDPMEMIVSKNRHGNTGTVYMQFFGATGQIYAQHNE